MKKSYTFKLPREGGTEKSTYGQVFDESGRHEFYTLEDPVREFGIKINGDTALAEGLYILKTTYSPAFDNDLVLIYNTEDFKVCQGGITFEGVRVHDGATHKNTQGCVLSSYVRESLDRIKPFTGAGIAFAWKVRELYRKYDVVYLDIKNDFKI